MTPKVIRECRLDLGLTAGQAGRLFGVGSRNWRRIEAGQLEARGPLVRLLIVACAFPAAVLPRLQSLKADITGEDEDDERE